MLHGRVVAIGQFDVLVNHFDLAFGHEAFVRHRNSTPWKAVLDNSAVKTLLIPSGRSGQTRVPPKPGMLCARPVRLVSNPRVTHVPTNGMNVLAIRLTAG